jgi:hypothetical protein
MTKVKARRRVRESPRAKIKLELHFVSAGRPTAGHVQTFPPVESVKDQLKGHISAASASARLTRTRIAKHSLGLIS